jgi:hypothetical protein
MEFTTQINLIIAAVILLLVAAVFIGYQMKSLGAELKMVAYKFYFELTRKADLLPQVIEKLSAYVGRENLAELIQARSATMAISEITSDKKIKEEQLWSIFQTVWQNAQGQEAAQKDLVLTALRKDLAEADLRVGEMRDAYNLMVKKYNRLAGNFLLKPIGLIVKAKKAQSF